MCYEIYVSTNSPEDLGMLSRNLFRFGQPDEEREAGPIAMLSYPNKWYLSGRYGGCSCHFRHLSIWSESLGFGAPEDWFPEEVEEVESTAAAYDLFSRLVAEGWSLEALDTSSGANLGDMKSMKVSMGEVPRDSFRFFENFRFEFTP